MSLEMFLKLYSFKFLIHFFLLIHFLHVVIAQKPIVLNLGSAAVVRKTDHFSRSYVSNSILFEIAEYSCHSGQHTYFCLANCWAAACGYVRYAVQCVTLLYSCCSDFINCLLYSHMQSFSFVVYSLFKPRSIFLIFSIPKTILSKQN